MTTTNTKRTLKMNYNDPVDLQEIAKRWGLDFRCYGRNGRVLSYSCEGETSYGRTATVFFSAADSQIDDPEAWAHNMRETLENIDYCDPTYTDEDTTPEEAKENFDMFVSLVGGEDYNYDEDYDDRDEVIDDLTDFLKRVENTVSDFEYRFDIA